MHAVKGADQTFAEFTDNQTCMVQVHRLREDLMVGLAEEATHAGVQYVLQCCKRLPS